MGQAEGATRTGASDERFPPLGVGGGKTKDKKDGISLLRDDGGWGKVSSLQRDHHCGVRRAQGGIRTQGLALHLALWPRLHGMS